MRGSSRVSVAAALMALASFTPVASFCSVDTLVAEMDAHVIIGDTNVNYGDAQELLVADPHASDISRAYLRFNLEGIPGGATVNWAKLRLFNVTATDECSEIGVYRVLGTWDESTITWANQPDFAPYDQFEDIVNLGDDGGLKWVAWDVTELVSGWIPGSVENHGVVVKVPVEEASWYCVRTFISRENSETELRPLLVVCYDLEPLECPIAKDAYVDQSLPDSNYGSSENLLVVNTSWEVLRTYVQFDLTGIPEGSTVYLAELVLENYDWWDDICPEIQVHRAVEAWGETEITWNNQPEFDPDVAGTIFLRDDFFPTGMYVWNITGLVQKWVNGEYENHGLALRPRNEGNDSYRVARGFYAREAPGDYSKSGLYVSYESSPGVGDMSGRDWRARLFSSPNPSTGSIDVRLELAHAAHATLSVYDISGRLVRTIFDGYAAAGVHSIKWNGVDGGGRSVTSGTYFLRAVVGESCLTDKAVLIR